MRASPRLLATLNNAAPARARPKRRPLSLEHFLVRQRVIKLWRDIARAVYKIPPSKTRDEMRAYARGEFERNRHVSDLTQIRYLASTGKTEFDSMQRYVYEQAAR